MTHLTTIRSQAAADAALTVLCELTDLDAALAELGPLARPDDRLRAAVADLLHAMHSVRATLGVDVDIWDRANAAEAGAAPALPWVVMVRYADQASDTAWADSNWVTRDAAEARAAEAAGTASPDVVAWVERIEG